MLKIFTIINKKNNQSQMQSYVQFRRGTRAEYDALSEKDNNDLYVIGGDDQTVSMYVGDKMIQDVISDPIIVTSTFGSYNDGTTIEAGTTVAEILKNMLCKELFPTYTAPSASITYSTPPSGNYFVGTTVTIPDLKLSMIRGTFNSQWPQDPPEYDTSNAKITTSELKGFDGYTTGIATGIVTGTVTGTAMIPPTIALKTGVTIQSGVNSFKVTGSYDYGAPTNNPVSNLNNQCTGQEFKWNAGTATATTKTIFCTGVYRIYSNAVVENTTLNGANAITTTQYSAVQSLTGKYPNVTTGSTFRLKLGFLPMEVSNTGTYREIHLPENVNIERQKGYGLAGYTVDSSFNYVKKEDGEEPLKYNGMPYNKFVYTPDNLGANTFEIDCKVYSSNQYPK